MREQLRASLGSSGGEQLKPLNARGTIEPLTGAYRLTLLIERGATHGTRVIESEDCRSLAKAAAIVLELLVQKERALGRELSESEISGQPEPVREPDTGQPQAPETQPELPAKPPDPPAPQKPIAPESSRTWRLLLRAPEGKADFMTLPRLGYGLGIGAGIAYPAWSALLTASSYGTDTEAAQGPNPHQVQFRRMSLTALGCQGGSYAGWADLRPCGVLALDHVRAHASGDYLESEDKTALWISVGAGLSGYLHVHRHVSLVVTGTGRIATDRARFSVGSPTGPKQSHRVPLAALDIALACEWIF